jgi:hypothetical protein
MPKLRVKEIDLSDDSKITIHEPAFSDLGLFLSCLPALSTAANIMGSMESKDGKIAPVPKIPPDLLDSLYPLIASMAGISEDELKSLGMWDGISLMWAAVSFLPKNALTQSTASPELTS